MATPASDAAKGFADVLRGGATETGHPPAYYTDSMMSQQPKSLVDRIMGARPYLTARHATDLESSNKNWVNGSGAYSIANRATFETGYPPDNGPPKYFGPSSNNEQRTKGKLRARLTKLNPYLPILAYLLAAGCALPGFFFIAQDVKTRGLCSKEEPRLSGSRILWITYFVMWMVLMISEYVNWAFRGNKKGEHMKEAVRVLMGPLIVGVSMGIGAGVAEGVKSHYCVE